MAYIYQIVNDINGKIYVGKTEFSIEKRFQEHCRDSRKENINRPLYAAMRKYGIEHFHISILEETDNPEERERYWIELLGTFKNGYNATIGGDGKKYLNYDLVISLYKEIKNQNEVARILKIDQATVRKIIHQADIKVLSQKEAMTQLAKKVAKLDPKTNKIIQVYSSIQEAERENGNTKHISSVCKGKRKTCAGYKWQYI